MGKGKPTGQPKDKPFEPPTPGIKRLCSTCSKEVPAQCSGTCNRGVRGTQIS